MDGKWIPESYNQEAGVVRTDRSDGDKRIGKAQHYVFDACRYYRRYADPEMLLWAVEHAWPEVSDSYEARTLFAELVRTKTLGKRGVSVEKQKTDDERNARILERVWYYKGMGYRTRYPENAPVSKENACSLTGNEVGLSSQQVFKIWQSFGGDDPVGVFRIVAIYATEKGRAAAKSAE